MRATLDVDSFFAPTHHRLGLTYGALGKYEQAITHLREAQQLSADSWQAMGALGHASGMTGNQAAAVEILRQTTKLSQICYVSVESFAEVHLGLGDYGNVFEWVGKDAEERASALVRLKVDPRF